MNVYENASLMCVCGDRNCDIPYGTCHCGCGEKTSIWEKTDNTAGRVKGQPKKRIDGHSRKVRLILEDAAPFKIDDIYCRLILLTQGMYAIVSESDYVWVMQWKWCATRSSSTGKWYAMRKDKNDKTIWMHRDLFGLTTGDKREVDHIDPDNTLNNARSNLRIVSRGQNVWNKKRQVNNTSGFKGVTKNGSGWMAQLKANGEYIYLGTRRTKEEAAALYRESVPKYHGEFGRCD
jgi:hypothetical protein